VSKINLKYLLPNIANAVSYRKFLTLIIGFSLRLHIQTSSFVSDFLTKASVNSLIFFTLVNCNFGVDLFQLSVPAHITAVTYYDSFHLNSSINLFFITFYVKSARDGFGNSGN
jgi:hypothetical protein